VERGETPVVALQRELTEELGISATVGDEITRYEYTYPGRNPIELMFYAVNQFEGEPLNLIFEEIRWESRANLPGYDFLEGDVEFVKNLA
jgi:8-oxo-dGTP diphosphatase